MSENKNIAIIGMGKMGQNHLRCLQKIPGVCVSAIVEPLGFTDIDAPVFSSVQEMIDSKIPDCAVVSSPTSFHFQNSKPLLQNRVPTLIEKPIASNMRDATELKNLSKKYSVPVATGFIERFNPSVQYVKDFLKFEKIITCDITRGGPNPKRISDVGVDLDLAIHDIDLLRFITGENILDSFSCKHSLVASGTPTTVKTFLKLESSSATITSSWDFPYKERKMRILTDKSIYHINLMEHKIERVCMQETGSNKEHYFPDSYNALEKQLNKFLKYAIMGEKNDVATIEDGLAALATVIKQGDSK